MTNFAFDQKFKIMSHLTSEQRYTISKMNDNGYSQKSIAETIGKDKSVVSRELRRNKDPNTGRYEASTAQDLYRQRMHAKPKSIRMSDEIVQMVNIYLSADFSPEQIVGRCRLIGADCVSHERIYQYVWADKKAGGTLYKHLRRKGRKYRRRGDKRDRRGIIRDRVGIEKRPAVVDEKIRFGDLEIDTVIGCNHKGALLTINDRVSSLCWIEPLNGKDAEELAQAAIRKLEPLKGIVKTITADNGKEFAFHKKIAQALGVNFFFAHPYHSWERGANENMNGLIRQYHLKGTSFENLDRKNTQLTQSKLNNRPRKKLNFLTPIEFFSRTFAPLTENENRKVAFIT